MNLRNSNLIYVFLFSLLLSISLVACQPSPDSSEILTEGKNDFENGNYQNVISKLRPYIYYHPKNYEAHFLLGQSFLSLSSNTEDELYKARYYLSKASDLSESADQRQAAYEAYLKAKSLMGKEDKQNAKDLHSSAEEALLLNKKGLALNLFIDAAKLNLLDEEYSKAQRDFSSGLDIALNMKDEDNTECLPDLIVGLATSYLLDNEPQKCLDTIKKHTKINISTKPLTALDSNFLHSAANLLLIEGQRKTLTLWKKTLGSDEDQNFNKRFDELIQFQQKESLNLSKEKKILLARAWYLIADHSHDLKMIRQANQAFGRAQTFFLSAGLKEEALDIGKKIDDYKKTL
jgi:hypothetical protein